jgi:hypothetical protein
MLQQIIDLNPIEPARLGFAQARGQGLRCSFLFRAPPPAAADMTDSNPQLVMRPRSRLGAVQGYDITVTSPNTGEVDIEGAALQDPNGYNVELYARDTAKRPTALLAAGAMVMTGGAYAYTGPYGPMTLPVVAGPPGPAGPAGAAGEPGIAGQRGSTWTTGAGAPLVLGNEVNGDMYLQDNGDVWRFAGGVWTVGTF